MSDQTMLFQVKNHDKSVFYSSAQSPLFRDLGISFVLSSRLEGASNPPYRSLNLGYHTGDKRENVAQNRAKILSKYFPQKTLIFCNQTHSNEILRFDNNMPSQNLQKFGLLKEQNLGQGDGIFCPQNIGKGVVALILVADCNPVLIFDTQKSAFVALHAGRAGVCAQIFTNGVQMLIANGAKAQNLRVFIGASIRSCCYEVGEDLARQIAQDFGTKYVEKRDEKYFLDLIAMLLDECENLGILRENVEVLKACSCCEKRLFSHRRASKKACQNAQRKSSRVRKNNTKNGESNSTNQSAQHITDTGRFGLFVSLK